ncbi:MAG: hypothetical protein UZ05_CHB002002768 [Chlorobi bacterium OLB5]|nr:MAG: hypothetical protein UZ05_CHB002002768 [Chlorobi bacterium OLB5]
MAKRVLLDCRDFPNEIDCTLVISGKLKEVMKISLRHAVEEHGHKKYSRAEKTNQSND